MAAFALNPETGKILMKRVLLLLAAVLFGGFLIAATIAFRLDQDQAMPVVRDGRLGQIAEVQGVLLVRPEGHTRWTMVSARTPIYPGDWLRTPSLGAHAAEIVLDGFGRFVMGPGGQVELGKNGGIRVEAGVFEVLPDKGKVLLAKGLGGDASLEVSKRVVLKAKRMGVPQAMGVEPKWVKGFHNSTTSEWMGSLLAKVDGRDVPLHIGTHEVSVVIRDQVVETTIVESFVNQSDKDLEGEFVFPLPPGATISGFGMWFGNELVDADLVTRAKARRIYQDLKKRKKDPALLEWSGGNLFRAKVYPIRKHSSKRIRIRYTQVLAREGRTVRYRYGLRSDLLREHPLERLEIKVEIASSVKLGKVYSPSHPCRIRKGERTARVEFSARNYRPAEDFELAYEVKPEGPISFVSHRRGEEGYFLLFMSAPGEEGGAWKRLLVPEGEGLDLILLADTSASADAAQRRRQEKFLQALLAMLSPQDHFRLAACDETTVWLVPQATAATKENVQKALSALHARPSLGRTAPLAYLEGALGKANSKSVILYLGDGRPTLGEKNASELAIRIRGLAKAKTPSCFALPLGLSQEHQVLGAIASLGGGSLLSDRKEIEQTAGRFMSEIAAPSLKNLQLEIEGFATARVFPRKLPNLPRGGQQIVVGRFLPEDKSLEGTVRIKGVLDGKVQNFEARVVLPVAEGGNDFLPRLWATHYIADLRSQGSSKTLVQEATQTSLNYGVMSPFTSFIVVRDPDDRKKYGLDERIQIRDGEGFFAEAKYKVSSELLREQILAARGWRSGLRARFLRQIASLGRGALVPPTPRLLRRQVEQLGRVGGSLRTFSGSPVTGGGGSYRGPGDATPPSGKSWGQSLGSKEKGGLPMESVDDFFSSSPSSPRRNPGKRMRRELDFEASTKRGFVGSSWDGFQEEMPEEEVMDKDGKSNAWIRSGYQVGAIVAPSSPAPRKKAKRRYRPYPSGPSVINRVFSFPYLGKAPEPEEELSPNPEWPTGLDGLLGMYAKKYQLKAQSGALRIEEKSFDLHPLTGRVLNHQGVLLLRGGEDWYQRTWAWGQLPQENWKAGEKRVAFIRALGLGKSRASERGDVFPLVGRDGSMADFPRYFHDYDAKIETKDEVNVVTFSLPFPNEEAHVLVLDRKKKCPRSWTKKIRGEVDWTMTYGDFHQAGGLWWAGSAQLRDKRGRLYRSFSRKVRGGDLGGEMAKRSTLPSDAFVLPAELRLVEAKQRDFEGKANPADLWLLLEFETARQAKDKAMGYWDKLKGFLASRPSKGWLGLTLLASVRDHPSLQKGLFRQAGLVGMNESAAQLALAQGILGLARMVLLPEDWGKLLDIWEKDGKLMGSVPFRAFIDFARLDLYQKTGRIDLLLARSKEMTGRNPGDFELGFSHLQRVQLYRGYEEAQPLFLAWASGEKPLLRSERTRLFQNWFKNLKVRRDLDGIMEIAGLWASLDPESWEAVRLQHEVPFYQGFGERELAWARRLVQSQDFPTKDKLSELWAACRLVLGMGAFQNRNRVEGEDWETVARVLLRVFREDRRPPSLLTELLGNWRFKQSPGWKFLKTEWKAELGNESFVQDASPSTLSFYLRYVPIATTVEDLKAVAMVRKRWEGSKGVARAYLGDWIVRHQVDKGEKKAFLKLWASRCWDEEKADVLSRLLRIRLQDPWSQDVYGDVVGYAAQVIGALESDRSKKARGPSLAEQIAKGLLASWKKDLLGPLAKLEKLPRKERRRLEREADQKARKGLAERFLVLGGQGLKFLRPWYTLEGLRFSVESGWKLSEAGDKALGLLVQDLGLFPVQKNAFDRSLTLVASYAAVRRDSPPALAKKVESFFAARAKPRMLPPAKGLDWRVERFRLLVALDHPKQIEKALASWTLPASVEGRWYQAKGLMSAEAGRFEEAVKAFEAARIRDSLSASGLKILSVWNLVLGREEARRAARKEAFAHQSVQQIYSYLSSLRYDRKREIGPEAIEAAETLMRKAPQPQNYLWFLKDTYSNRKDTRILRAIAYGIPGHGQKTIYSFLQQVAVILVRVKREAAFDELRRSCEIVAAICKSRAERRGLSFLRGLIETRAAYVKNQPGIAGKPAVQYLKQAMQGRFESGEPFLAARFLASLGRGSYASLSSFRKESIMMLLHMVEEGSATWLHIAKSVSDVLASLKEFSASLDFLESAIETRRKVLNSCLPDIELTSLWALVSKLQKFGRYYDAEGQLQKEAALHEDALGRKRLARRIYICRLKALLHKGRVRPGSGRSLYRFLRKEFLARFEVEEEKTVQNFQDFCSLHSQVAKAHVIPEAGSDLISFGAEWGKFRKGLLYEDPRWTSVLSHAIGRAKGHRASLEFLVKAILEEPEWFPLVGLEGWQHHAWRLGWLRYKVGTLSPALADDLFKIVKRELERDLLTMSSRSRYLYHRQGSYYWAARKGGFRTVALKVLELYGEREDIRLYTARYLWWGLEAREEALAALDFFYQKGKLSRAGRGTFVSWLCKLKRYSKALPVLEQLLKEDSSRLDWRLLKLQVLAGLNKLDEARSYLSALDSWMHKAKFWNPGNVRSIAYRLEDGGMLAEASQYLEKAIRLYERSRRRPDYWTGETYERWAKLLTKLGKHQKAYEAASTAVLSFANPNWKSRRRQAVNVLRFILKLHPDLESLAKAHEEEVKRTGEDVPLLRKVLGEIFFARRDYSLAAQQWEALRDLDPLDKTNYDRLVSLYERTGNVKAQIAVVFGRLQEFPRDKKQYALLAQLLKGLGKPLLAQRASSSPEDL
jgi:tetratricopeptide (TPR) repeat protein